MWTPRWPPLIDVSSASECYSVCRHFRFRDADGEVDQQSQSADFQGVVRIQNERHDSCNFFSDIAHLSYQNHGGSKELVQVGIAPNHLHYQKQLSPAALSLPDILTAGGRGPSV